MMSGSFPPMLIPRKVLISPHFFAFSTTGLWETGFAFFLAAARRCWRFPASSPGRAGSGAERGVAGTLGLGGLV
jgi:hypothetical protein